MRGLTHDFSAMVRSAGAIYLITYVAVSLFPFDFILSWAELAHLSGFKTLATLSR